MRDTAGSAAAPAARCKNLRRGSFKVSNQSRIMFVLYYRMSGSEPNVILDGSGGLEIGPLWPDCFFFSSSFQRVFILILEPLRLEVPCFALDDV